MNELKKVENNAAALQVISEKELLSFLDLHGFSGLKPKQKEQFLKYAIMNNLNPFKKEIYIIAYGDQFSIITGYETYIRRAEESGRLDGWIVKLYGSIKDGNLTAEITIHRKDYKHPFVHEVYFEEYNTGKSIWRSKPKTMLKKVATSQGMRLCFNDVLGYLPYAESEMGEVIDISSSQIKEVENPQISIPTTEKKELTELLPDTKFWDNAFEALCSEKITISDVEQKYFLSEENKELLIGQVVDFMQEKEQENV